MALPEKFYERSTVKVARDLIGCYLVHETEDGRTAGRIVETEAYLHDDAASHSFPGKTRRNAAMFGPAGTAYVYLIYGMHYCFNVVTREEGVGEAVLIRALEPAEGIELMRKRRGGSDMHDLCSGPGKLCQAMAIARKENGKSLVTGKLFIEQGKKHAIVSSTRIGISRNADKNWRFCMKGNRSVSRK